MKFIFNLFPKTAIIAFALQVFASILKEKPDSKVKEFILNPDTEKAVDEVYKTFKSVKKELSTPNANHTRAN